MAYYLTLKNNKTYKTIDLTSSKSFKRLSRFKNDSYSLEELDEFTSKFSDEVSLKEKLFETLLIEFDDIPSEISVRFKQNNELKKIKYDLVYNDAKKYFDVCYLRSVFLVLCNDKEFLNKLVSNYRNSYCNAETIIRIANYSYDTYNFGTKLYNEICQFFLNEIYSSDKNSGEAKIKYKSLHDLAMFVYNYVHKKDLLSQGTTVELENLQKKRDLLNLQKRLIINGSNPVCSLRVKKLNKNKKDMQVDGQISLF